MAAAEEEVTTDAEQPASMPDVSLELAVEQQLEPEAPSEADEHQPDPTLTTESVAAGKLDFRLLLRNQRKLQERRPAHQSPN